jgi:hypothetical protein
LQGAYPVISLSFANIKETNYASTRKKICQMIAKLYTKYTFLLKDDFMEKEDLDFFKRITVSLYFSYYNDNNKQK